MSITPRLVITEFDDHSADADATEAPAEFVLPEDLSGLDDAALAALEAEAVEAFDAIRTGTLDTEALQSLSDLTTAIEAIRGEAGTRLEAAAEAAAAAEELAARVHPVIEDEVVEDATVDAAEAPAVDDVALPVAAAVEDAQEAAEAPVTADEPVVTAASIPAAPRRPIRVPLSAIRAAAPDPQVETGTGQVVITAAADLPGLSPGSRFGSLEDVARSMHARARRLGDGHSAPIASIETRGEFVIGARDGADRQREVLMAAASLDTLTASGGWCTPSRVLYDLFSIEATDGLWDVPTVTVDRGGIEYVEDGGPSIADIFANASASWEWTEANDVTAAGNPHLDPDDDLVKPSIDVPCPTWTETRLSAHGVWVNHGNLADQAFPEMTTRYLALVMAGHVHSKNARHLLAAVQLADAVTMGASVSGATANLLGATELQAADLRDKFRMSESALLEAVYPNWLRGVVRSDLAKRMGVDLLDVSDAQIAGWFANRGVRPQFVYDWQSLQSGPDKAGSPDGFREAYPTTAKFLIYPAGTYAVGNGPSIDLGVSRDSTQNATNDHTAIFTEEARLVAKVGHEARVVTVPIEPSGATHGGVTDTESATQTY